VAVSQQSAASGTAQLGSGGGSDGVVEEVIECGGEGEDECLLPWARAAAKSDGPLASCGDADDACPLP
jgi:hypothetical protein